MQRSVSILIFFIACQVELFAQLTPELPLIINKPGIFEILSRTDYTSSDCRFTKAEITANLQKITEVVNSVRKNPVLSDIKGFDGRARIYNVNCNDDGNYGIPSRISFEFASWYRKKDGTEARGFTEPPEWSMIINKLKATNGWQFSAETIFGDPRFFIVPLKKETIETGIDVYDGECYVIYNPDRPPYWLPVTVKEVFNGLIYAWKNNPDTIASAFMLNIIGKEYTATPESELNKPAYYGGGAPISVVSSINQSPPIVRVNPGYWDRSLPKSAIQFIYFRSVPNKEYYRKLKEECLQHNSISYNQYRFEESFDIKNIRALVPLIGK